MRVWGQQMTFSRIHDDPMRSRISNGPKECQRAFEELKAYLAKLPLLVKSILGDTLYLYISSMSQAVNSVLGSSNTPLKQVLGKPEASGRLIKWTIELSEYDISYLPQTTTKDQALADFVSEVTGMTQEEVPEERPLLLHVDGSSTTQGSGMGVVITSPQGENMEFAIKFDFKISNNEAE
ncbi:hypothetical protein Sango_0797100 [Sesamum angolense]|uniref:Reverse transcriptase/retrotransposon-derived protein RNase H-like domain-containing protein n=1 Tax=Sesamum angolense TaxID=2727404 RepID=A0AAE2C0K1_9LAMI|nr:hypothetical protein Sango_0797100 [Sesamum angolense]